MSPPLDLKKLNNPFRHNQYGDKQLIEDLRKLVRELQERLDQIQEKINNP